MFLSNQKSNFSNLYRIVHNWTQNLSKLFPHKRTDLYKFHIKKLAKNKIKDLMKRLSQDETKKRKRRREKKLSWLILAAVFFSCGTAVRLHPNIIYLFN